MIIIISGWFHVTLWKFGFAIPGMCHTLLHESDIVSHLTFHGSSVEELDQISPGTSIIELNWDNYISAG